MTSFPRQVDGTTCGPSVLLALAALAEGNRPSAERAGAAQRRAHRQANRFWPRFLGTTPSGMRSWLHRHAPAAGRYRIRWTFGTAPPAVRDAVTRAATAGRPVPLMVGSWIPRHWVLVTGADAGGWQVYEPASGEVRCLDAARLTAGTATPALGWPRLHAALLPVRPRSAGGSSPGRGSRTSAHPVSGFSGRRPGPAAAPEPGGNPAVPGS